MKEKILEALKLAKKFYNEQLEGNHDHSDQELVRYYKLENEIAEEYQRLLVFDGWYGAICALKDLLKFEF